MLSGWGVGRNDEAHSTDFNYGKPCLFLQFPTLLTAHFKASVINETVFRLLKHSEMGDGLIYKQIQGLLKRNISPTCSLSCQESRTSKGAVVPISQGSGDIICCVVFMLQDFGSGGSTVVYSVRSCQNLPLCLIETMQVGSKMDPLQARLNHQWWWYCLCDNMFKEG